MKRTLRYFISYTRDDAKLPERLLLELRKKLGADGDYEFEPWSDSEIPVGSNWHEEIQSALIKCDFGLLLVSPAFLGKRYITSHELPHFVRGEKPCVPVALSRIDLQEMDLKGLEPMQFFGLVAKNDVRPRSFEECRSAQHRSAFAHQLYLAIKARLAILFAETSSDSMDSDTSSGVNEPAYRSHIYKHYRQLQLEAFGEDAIYSNAGLQQVFVPQDARDCGEWLPEKLQGPADLTLQDATEFSFAALHDQRRFRETAARGIYEIIDPSADRCRVLLGAPGAGKSSFTRICLLRWLAENAKVRHPLPVLIELRLFHRSGRTDFLDYLENDKDVVFRFSRQSLHARLEAGTAELYFDGLDEIFDRPARDTAARLIVHYAEVYPKASFLVTSRLGGYVARILRDAGFAHWVLADFDDEKIARFLAYWTTNVIREPSHRPIVRRRIQEALRNSVIRELASNPLLLTLMAMLARKSDLPRDLGSLYARASDLLLDQWDTHRSLASEVALGSVVIDQQDKRNLLRDLAWKMQVGQRGLRGNLIGESEVRDAMHAAFEHRIPDPGLRRKAVTLLINQLIQRNYILCHVGGAQFAFVHRGFLEFFCAEKILFLCAESGQSPVTAATQLFRERVHSDAWMQVLALAAVNLPPEVADATLATMVNEDWVKADPPYLAPLELAVNALRHSRDRKSLPRTDTLIRTIVEDHVRRTLVISAESRCSDNFDLRCLQFIGWLGADESCVRVLEEIIKQGRDSAMIPMAFWALASIRPDRRTLVLGRAALELPMNGVYSGHWMGSLKDTMMRASFPKDDLISVLSSLTETVDPDLSRWASERLEEKLRGQEQQPSSKPLFSNGDTALVG